jgi:hypothetical protein
VKFTTAKTISIKMDAAMHTGQLILEENCPCNAPIPSFFTLVKGIMDKREGDILTVGAKFMMQQGRFV